MFIEKKKVAHYMYVKFILYCVIIRIWSGSIFMDCIGPFFHKCTSSPKYETVFILGPQSYLPMNLW